MQLQYCAILSQEHRHSDAYDQAREAIRLNHVLINDMKALCTLYMRRVDVQNVEIETGNSARGRDAFS